MKRIGIDTGGTFTDGVMLDEETGQITSAKVSSDNVDPSQAVMRCVVKIAGERARDIRSLVHGTTVATNAALERSGPRIGMICTAGFRDVVEIARLGRSPEQLYDVHAQQPATLAKRRDRLEVTERVDKDGTVVTELDETTVTAAAQVFKKRGIKAVGVCLLHSYVNPMHERLVREILQREIPDLLISISSEVFPEFREFERSTTTALNAYLAPVVSGYMSNLKDAVEQWSEATQLWVMQSNGGVASAARSARSPVTLLLSGPSGGVVAGHYLMQQMGIRRSITMDMGGTSYDVCLLPETGIPVAQERQVMGMPIKTPSVDILTIGAGGGSIGWVDLAGQFRVGPRSAGAAPGPACYGRGGAEPTVTDANLVLGVLGSEQRLGGEVALRTDLAVKACETLGIKLGMSAQATAWGIRRIVNAAMAGATRAISIGRGYDPRDFSLISFGGAGPVHATDIARELEIPEVAIPVAAGCLSALGLVVSDVTRDYVATRIHEVADGVEVGLTSELARLTEFAHGELASEKIAPEQRTLIYSVDMRYVGEQAYVNVPIGNVRDDWLKATVVAFHGLHERLFGFKAEDEPVEVVNARVRAVGRLHARQVSVGVGSASSVSKTAKPISVRRVAFGPEPGDVAEVPVYHRDSFTPAMAFSGPAIIEESDTTVFVGPRDAVRIDDFLNIRLAVN